MNQNGTLLNGVEEVAKVIRVPRIQIRPFPDQPRKYFDKDELKKLAASIKTYGQREPGKVKEINNTDAEHKYELIDGQRRWHALDMAGIPKMKVIVEKVEDVEEQFLMSVMANFGRADHGPLEIANAIIRFRIRNKSVAEICEIFVKSDAWVYQHIKIAEKLDTDVQNMMAQEIPEEDRLAFSIALALTDIPMEYQKKLADKIVKGKMKTVPAKDLIRRKAEKLGIKVGTGRTPRKDYDILRNFLDRTERELKVFTQRKQDFFNDIFRARVGHDNETMCQDIENRITELRLLLSSIRKVR